MSATMEYKIMALFSYLLICTYKTAMSLNAAPQEAHSEAICTGYALTGKPCAQVSHIPFTQSKS